LLTFQNTWIYENVVAGGSRIAQQKPEAGKEHPNEAVWAHHG
jgi:hypothetical protein